MSGEEGEEPRPANIYIQGLISVVGEGDQRAAWRGVWEAGGGGGGGGRHRDTHIRTHPPGPNVRSQWLPREAGGEGC